MAQLCIILFHKPSRLLAAAVSAAVVQSFLPEQHPETHRDADLGVTSDSTYDSVATWPPWPHSPSPILTEGGPAIKTTNFSWDGGNGVGPSGEGALIPPA